MIRRWTCVGDSTSAGSGALDGSKGAVGQQLALVIVAEAKVQLTLPTFESTDLPNSAGGKGDRLKKRSANVTI